MQALQATKGDLFARIIDVSDASVEQWLMILPTNLHRFVLESHFPTLATSNTLTLTASAHHPNTVAQLLYVAAAAVQNGQHTLHTITLCAMALDGKGTSSTHKTPLPGLYPGHVFGSLQPKLIPGLVQLLRAAAPSLKALTIDESIITPAGAFHLSQLLATLQLEKLHLTRCQIGSQALQYVLHSLATTALQPTLASFSLAGTRLYPACVTPFSHALSKMPLLAEFDISLCIVSEVDTVPAIVRSAASIDSLTHLNVQDIIADGSAFSIDSLKAISECGAVDLELLSQFRGLVEFKGLLTMKRATADSSNTASKGTQPRSWPELRSLTVPRLDKASAQVVAGAWSLQELRCYRGGGMEAPSKSPSLRALLAPQTDKAAFELLKSHLSVAMLQLTALEVDLTAAQKTNSQHDVVLVIAQLSSLQELSLSVRLRSSSATELMKAVASWEHLKSFSLQGREDVGPTSQTGELLRDMYGSTEPPPEVIDHFKQLETVPAQPFSTSSPDNLDWLTPVVSGLCKSNSIHTVTISGSYQISEHTPEQNVSDLVVALEQLSCKQGMHSVKLPVIASLLGTASTSPGAREALLTALPGLPNALQLEAFILDDFSEESVLPALLASGNVIRNLRIYFPEEFCSSSEMQKRFSACVDLMHEVEEVRLCFRERSADPNATPPLLDEACVACLANALCKLSNVRELRMCTVSCPPRQFYDALMPGIANQECFEHLSIWSTRAPCRNLHCAPLVALAPNLKRLRLANCHLNDDDVGLLVEALLMSRPGDLEELDLSLNRRVTDKAAALLCSTFSVLWNLKYVSIKRTGVSGQGMTAMCRALVDHPKFTMLNALFNLGVGLGTCVHEIDTLDGDKDLGRAFFYSMLELLDQEAYYERVADERELERDLGDASSTSGSDGPDEAEQDDWCLIQ